YGEAFGILAGDGLLNYAYETAARAFLMEPDHPTLGKALGILASKTGIYGMIGGQSVDVEMEGKPLSREQLDFIYRLKTSALIEASMMIGAVLAGASEETVNEIEKIGGNIGLAFQIQDDILDVTGTEQVLGKPINSDEKNHKTTYVTIKGLEQAREDVEKISGQALAGLDALPCRDAFLRQLVVWLINRKN
ncbi:MAG: polyprenyl synthetase family protein, partial [Lachnospiraceae bacterium]|nr:polyprenyl synthetase family protein [Lachnospiraceae bacterium]